MFSKLFWKDVSERALWTFAQALLGTLTAAGFTPLGADWKLILIAAVTATAISVLKSVVIGGALLKNEPTVSPASTAVDSRGFVGK